MASSPPPIAGDLQLLLTAAEAGASAVILAALRDAGFADLRVSHGFVFQHLVPGPLAIAQLGQRLGMTAQGASKAVIELEQLGYVRRVTPLADRRAHLVELTPRGLAAIDAGRQARARFTARIRALLGADQTAALLESLRRVADHTGGLHALTARRLRATR